MKYLLIISLLTFQTTMIFGQNNVTKSIKISKDRYLVKSPGLSNDIISGLIITGFNKMRNEISVEFTLEPEIFSNGVNNVCRIGVYGRKKSINHRSCQEEFCWEKITQFSSQSITLKRSADLSEYIELFIGIWNVDPGVKARTGFSTLEECIKNGWDCIETISDIEDSEKIEFNIKLPQTEVNVRIAEK